MSRRIEDLAARAPDVVAAWRGIEAGDRASVRREIRRRVGAGSGDRLVDQLGATGELLAAIVAGLPDEALARPGGEEEWTTAQAIGHVADTRAGLVLAAARAAGGRWPEDAPAIVPGVPGPADASREQLLRRLRAAQRTVERAGRAVVGHELAPCPLDHPLVGRLRCGEWLLFAALHDLMHVEQVERLEAAG